MPASVLSNFLTRGRVAIWDSPPLMKFGGGQNAFPPIFTSDTACGRAYDPSSFRSPASLSSGHPNGCLSLCLIPFLLAYSMRILFFPGISLYSWILLWALSMSFIELSLLSLDLMLGIPPFVWIIKPLVFIPKVSQDSILRKSSVNPEWLRVYSV